VQVASRPASAVGVLVVALLCAGTALAGPAAAVDDESLPDARVTHGPSCRPGGIVVEVTAGTVGYAVTLATARRPTGEDAAELAPGAAAVLRTGPVTWDETIDPFLRYTALDGSGTGYVDELPGFDFTRPAAEDCAAIAPATVAAAVPAPGSPPPAGTVGGSPAVAVDGAVAAREVAAREVAAAAGDDGGRWPLLVAGGALLVAGAGIAAASGGRRPGSRAAVPPPFGSA
jgi:hypothetical protein